MSTTTSRLLRLLSLLQARRDWPGPVLADRLGVTPRTVRRDVERLRELGYSIASVKGPDGGYRLGAGTEMPPLLFDDDQAIALAVSLRSAPSAGAGVEEAAMRALLTLREVMPPRLRTVLDAPRFTNLPAPRAAEGPASPEVLVQLSAATRARRILRFDYSRGTGDGSMHGDERRRVEPHAVVARQGLWYLVAWDLDRGDWRLFRADRIAPRTPTGPGFARRPLPGGSAAHLVSARFRGGDRSGAWPCTGTVILDLPARSVAPFAGEGVVEDLGPERCSYESGSWSWVALAASLGRFDADIQVVHPPELAEAFALLSARYARVGVETGARPAP